MTATEPLAVPARSAWRIRPARPDDVPGILRLVRELAAYEREPDAVRATAESFRVALFSTHPRVHCHVAEVDTPEGPVVAGMAIWLVNFSTWRGRHGLWLEDLFVVPAYRRLGLGRALLGTLAAICAERGYPRMEWWVLDWNGDAHEFYRGLGASPQSGWTVWRLDDIPLQVLGTGS
jgi:GNAT superfamily N-acetyltransferase